MKVERARSEDRKKLSAGKALYERMRRELEVAPIIYTAVEDCGLRNHEDALYALDAFLQWFSLVPLRSESVPYVMLKSSIDKVWHAFILNTRLYRRFCERYVGEFIDHKPAPGDPPREYVEKTLNLLESHYGCCLHCEFQSWRRALEHM